MLVKKMLYVVRNGVISIVQMLIPVFFLIIAVLIVRNLPGINDSPPALATSFAPFQGTKTPIQEYLSTNESALLVREIHGLLQGANVAVNPNLDQDGNMTTYLLQQSTADLPSFNLKWMTSVEVLGVEGGKTFLSVLYNGKPYHVPPAALNLVDAAIARAHTGNTRLSLTTVNHPLPRTDTDKLTQDSRQNMGFQIGFNLAFGLSFLSGSLVMFLIRERSCNAKHLQFVSGVNFVTYWLATALIDFCMYLVPFFCALICLKIFNEEGLREPQQLGIIFLILVLFAWAMAPLMYLSSFLFSIPSSGFSWMSLINVFAGMATLITVTILRIPDLNLKHVADILDWLFMVFPPYSLAASITDLYTNYRFTKICDNEGIRLACDIGSFFANPCCKGTGNCGAFGCVEWERNVLSWRKLGIGRMLVFLAVEGALFYLIIALIELKVFQSLNYFLAKIKNKIFNREVEPAEVRSRDAELEEDVRHESLRVQGAQPDSLCKTNILVFRDLTKRYTSKHLAVDRLNLGVPRGECFGLLGINGAGKTTTFKMLTGDLPVSDGDAYVNGFSITNDIKKVQQEVGYCPQFDAILDQLTGRETLRMFARLRGVPEARIDEHITDLAAQLIVTPHLDNLVGNLSGGNKRKISTGIALIGEPPLVLLDEPTSGMDPVARRHLWDVLNAARDDGRSIILTSHSMEECEALCTRLAIMTNGKFRCLGSPQHLKNKFSEGYSLIVRVAMEGHQESDHIDIEQLPPEMLKMQQFIKEQFADPILREVQWGRLEYFISASGATWASVFGTMERSKELLDIVDYSVTQTTLERVFLNFTRTQISDE